MNKNIPQRQGHRNCAGTSAILGAGSEVPRNSVSAFQRMLIGGALGEEMNGGEGANKLTLEELKGLLA